MNTEDTHESSEKTLAARQLAFVKYHQKDFDRYIKTGFREGKIKSITYRWDTIEAVVPGGTIIARPTGSVKFGGYVNGDRNKSFGLEVKPNDLKAKNEDGHGRVVVDGESDYFYENFSDVLTEDGKYKYSDF